MQSSRTTLLKKGIFEFEIEFEVDFATSLSNYEITFDWNVYMVFVFPTFCFHFSRISTTYDVILVTLAQVMEQSYHRLATISPVSNQLHTVSDENVANIRCEYY